MLEEFGYAILKLFLEITLAWVVFSYLLSPRRTFGQINSSWAHIFTEMQFSTAEFYEAIEKSIKAKGIPNISTHIVQYSTSAYFLTDRKYLQIRRGDQMVLVCAAPFSRDFFVSWRSGTTLDFMLDLLPRIPAIGIPLARLMFSKTFFQQDTDLMFKEAVKDCVMEVIDSITTAKGVRGLTELERQSRDIPLKLEYSR